MFCTTLRKRPEWTSLVPLLLASQVPKWSEKMLSTHDIAVLVPRQDDHHRQVRMVLLSAADLGSMDEGMARIERLYHLHGGHDVGVVFLMEGGEGNDHEKENGRERKEKGVVAYMELQSRLTSLSFEIPILPLTSVGSLPATILAYQRQLLRPKVLPIPVNAMTAILPFCTEMPRLPEHAQHVLSDVFKNLKGLALAATTPDGQEEIGRWLSEPTAAQVIAFWQEEYIADC